MGDGVIAGDSVRILYEIEQLPIFQNRMYDSKASAIGCPRGDVCLVENLETGLVYNQAFDPSRMQYDEYYQNEQAVSPLFKAHLEAVAQIISRTIGRTSIVEVGCGKGFFLEMMLADGFDVQGFDPTYEGDNDRVTRQHFSSELGINADGLVLRHVLEHVQNPVEFLMQLRDANGGGKIYIEVPCLDWICNQHAWFDIFYEHVNYFRIADIHRMFDVVYESGRLFGDQYLYVVADLSSLRHPKIDTEDRAKFPTNIISRLTQEADDGSNGKLIIWGGASKGVIFSLLMQRAGIKICAVIDINPAKQNKYLPASGFQVRAPEEVLPTVQAGARIFVMNSNYLQEIQDMSENKFTYLSIDG